MQALLSEYLSPDDLACDGNGQPLINIRQHAPGKVIVSFVGCETLVDETSTPLRNPFYFPKLQQRNTTAWWPYLVFWIDAIVGNRPRKCNATSETSFKVLKNVAFKGWKPSRLDSYVIEREKDWLQTTAMYHENVLKAKAVAASRTKRYDRARAQLRLALNHVLLSCMYALFLLIVL
jgi:hypothetical protein